MTSAIEISGVGKQYRRGMQAYTYNRASEVMANWGKRLIGAGPREARAARADETFWALKDISLTIEKGQVVGIIGRNGSGKSTLLKIISQITAPTTGELRITGRTGTLLEVGTGFHPELSGRENVFLNGAILGMSRQEIARKFDEIVDFSGVEAFIDTPVKRYSSGMQTRLAFSVAAHLDPEILIVDEVLAVGDAEFQKKCLGKMKDVTGDGRTVVFVSHNMGTVTSLCDRCVLLGEGQVQAEGDPHYVADLYFNGQGASNGAAIDFSSRAVQPGDDVARLLRAGIVDENLQPISSADRSMSVGVEMTFEVLEDGHRLVPNFHVFLQDQYAFVSSPYQKDVLSPGVYRSIMWVPPNLLNGGLYLFGVALTSMNPMVLHFYERDALRLHLVEDLHHPDRNGYAQAYPGVLRPDLKWDIVQKANAGAVGV
jgi:lipopolysaccharide transport system ATP-binding protein